MSIRFAASNSPNKLAVSSPTAKMLVRRVLHRAANDNFDEQDSDLLLQAALRHFAQHGLGAARSARAQAQHAFFAGDRRAYDWWLGITRALDRRLAIEAEHQFTTGKNS